jgi:hypothetical protein
MDSRTFNRGEETVEAPGYTPWFDAYMKLYLQSIPTLVIVYSKFSILCHFSGKVILVAAFSLFPKYLPSKKMVQSVAGSSCLRWISISLEFKF